MSGSNETRASEAFEKPGSHDRVLTWVVANRMLPLVQRRRRRDRLSTATWR